MKYKFGFVVDTASTYNIKNSENVYVIPIEIIVNFKNGDIKNFQEGINIDIPDIVNYLRQGCDISTSQPNLELAKTIIDKALTECEKIIVLPLPIGISGFYNNLANYYQDNKNVIVIKSRSISIQGNWCIQDLTEKFNNNELSIDTESVNAYMESVYNKSCGVCILGSLNQLIKGGRLKGFKKLISQIFKLKITIRFDGELNKWDQNISLLNSVNKALLLIDSKINYTKNGIKRLMIADQLIDKNESKKLIDILLKKLNINTYEPCLLPGSVVAHVGDNTFSFLIETY